MDDKQRELKEKIEDRVQQVVDLMTGVPPKDLIKIIKSIDFHFLLNRRTDEIKLDSGNDLKNPEMDRIQNEAKLLKYRANALNDNSGKIVKDGSRSHNESQDVYAKVNHFGFKETDVEFVKHI